MTVRATHRSHGHEPRPSCDRSGGSRWPSSPVPARDGPLDVWVAAFRVLPVSEMPFVTRGVAVVQAGSPGSEYPRRSCVPPASSHWSGIRARTVRGGVGASPVEPPVHRAWAASGTTGRAGAAPAPVTPRCPPHGQRPSCTPLDWNPPKPGTTAESPLPGRPVAFGRATQSSPGSQTSSAEQVAGAAPPPDRSVQPWPTR